MTGAIGVGGSVAGLAVGGRWALAAATALLAAVIVAAAARVRVRTVRLTRNTADGTRTTMTLTVDRIPRKRPPPRPGSGPPRPGEPESLTGK